MELLWLDFLTLWRKRGSIDNAAVIENGRIIKAPEPGAENDVYLKNLMDMAPVSCR
jgi:hypothetical protein